MEITVALDGEKKRDLRFFAGDDMSLTIVVYEHDGDVSPIVVSNVRFAAADGSLPMDSEFVVPSNFFGRVPYRIVGEVEDITTTLAYGVMQTEGGWPSLFCWCSGSPWPYGIVGKADNITVLDAHANFDGTVSVEGALQELGDFKKSVGDIGAAVETATEAAESASEDAAYVAAQLPNLLTKSEAAAVNGAALLAFTAAEAQSIFDNALPMASYTPLRAYTGRALGVRITAVGLAGVFWRDASDTTSADNGGTIIVDASGRRWKRVFTGAAAAAWFGVSAAASAAMNTPLIQAALDAVDHVTVDGGVIPAETLTMNRLGGVLEVQAGATLQFGTPTVSSVIVAADVCTIMGAGTIKNTPTFNGTQGEMLYGVIYATGNGLTMRDVRLDGVPKCGINLKGSTRHKIIGVTIDGEILKASYNEADPNTLNHHGIAYDPPSDATTDDVGVQIIGCEISGVIQGVSSGNYGAAARQGGVVIEGNVFRHCWDHGNYLNATASNYSVINGNSYYECRRPIVSGGVGASVIGNTAIGSTMDATMEQVFSIRDAIDCNVSGNTILGFGAAIDVRPLLGTVTTGNRIDNNVVKAAGVSSPGCTIRVGGTTCESNTVTNNTAEGYPTANFAVLYMDSGKFNVMDNNNATSLNTNYAIRFSDQESGSCSGNRLLMSADAASSTTVSMHYLSNTTNCDISRNSYLYKTGGANVTARGQNFQNTQTGNNVTDNVFELTATFGGGATAQFSLSYTANNCARNWLTRSAAMCGTFGWSSGTTSVTVNNANVVAGSTIFIVPSTAAAGTVQKTNGVHVTVAAGSFTLTTSDGATTAATSNWRYEIR